MLKKINKYVNGNYTVTLYEDGTKEREVPEEGCKPEFPESIDLKITNKCDKGCAYCHEDSTPGGEQSNFEHDFLWTLRPGTELAIGGGNIFEMCESEGNNQIRDFLIWCDNRGIIPNLTVNQTHLELEETRFNDGRSYIHTNRHLEYLKEWKKRNLFYGLGISFNGNAEKFEQIFNFEERYNKEEHRYLIDRIKKDTVIHVINGVDLVDEILKLSNKGYKLLILGYKDIRKGKEFKNNFEKEVELRQKEMYERIHEIIRGFDVVSFDNLAIEQLNLKRMFTSDDWQEFYMGDEGTFTMYIDLVEKEFASSSTSGIRYPLEESIDKMFQRVLEE